jgi:hypothetical protein
LPGRRSELRPLKRGLLFSLLTWLLLVGRATGQAPGTSPGRVLVGANLSITTVASEWVPQAGAAISLRLTPRITVGAVGRVDLEPLTIEGQHVRVRFGYGGVRVGVQALSPGLAVSLLAGAGNVDALESVVENVVDSENGAIVEPGISYTYGLVGRLGVSATASWRTAFEFEEVVGLDSSDFSGPTLGIELTFGPF